MGRDDRRWCTPGRALAVSLVALAAWATTGVAAVEPGAAQVPAAQARAASPGSEGVRLYLDLSQSMRGFDRSPASSLVGLARELKNVMTLSGVDEWEAVGFGTGLGKPVPSASLSEALGWEATQNDTCLTIPAEEELRLLKDSRGLTRRFMVTVTDGVADATRIGACGSTCPTGSDQTCMATALKDYVRSGFALSIVAVKVPFRGTFYPAGGGRTNVSPPVQRPLYFIVGGPSVATVASIVDSLHGWASTHGTPVVAIDVWPAARQQLRLGAVRSSNAFSPPAGALSQACMRASNVDVDALPTPTSQTVTVRARRTGQRNWALRIPIRTISETSEHGQKMFAAVPSVQVSGGNLQQWKPDLAHGYGDACVSWAGPTITFAVDQHVSMAPWQKAVSEWSEDFGKGLKADPTRTEGLLELLNLTARLVEKEIGTDSSPLLTVRVGAAGGSR